MALQRLGDNGETEPSMALIGLAAPTVAGGQSSDSFISLVDAGPSRGNLAAFQRSAVTTI